MQGAGGKWSRVGLPSPVAKEETDCLLNIRENLICVLCRINNRPSWQSVCRLAVPLDDPSMVLDRSRTPESGCFLQLLSFYAQLGRDVQQYCQVLCDTFCGNQVQLMDDIPLQSVRPVLDRIG